MTGRAAAQGYMVVIQDVRGRGTSGGTFRLCEAEKRDGAETVAWAAALPGSSGAVGMYGFSYQGMTQLFAAAARPPALKAIAPAMTAWRVREDFATDGARFACNPASAGAANWRWRPCVAVATRDCTRRYMPPATSTCCRSPGSIIG